MNMILSFELSMPSNNSWNGKWSGDGRCYAIVKTYKGNSAIAKARELADKRSYFYSWSDGWTACITVKEVTPQEGQRLREGSKGFCGYEWMIHSIERYGKIYADHEIPKEVPTPA